MTQISFSTKLMVTKISHRTHNDWYLYLKYVHKKYIFHSSLLNDKSISTICVLAEQHCKCVSVTVRGAGTVRSGGSNDPQQFTWGPGGQTWYFDPPIFVERNIFWYTLTCCYWGYTTIILYSETRSNSVFFVIIYNTFVDSSKLALMILTHPRPVKKIVPARLVSVDSSWIILTIITM